MPIATFRQFVDLYPFERTRTVYGQCDVFSDEGEHLGIREVKYRDVESYHADEKGQALSLRTKDGEVDSKRVEADVLQAVTDQAAADAQAEIDRKLQAEAEERARLEGYDYVVVDSHGQPIAGATVQVVDAEGKPVYSEGTKLSAAGRGVKG